MALILLMISALLTAACHNARKGTRHHGAAPCHAAFAREIFSEKSPLCSPGRIDGLLILAWANFCSAFVSRKRLLLSAASLIYIFTALPWAFNKHIARKQEHALLIVMPVTMLPTMFLRVHLPAFIIARMVAGDITNRSALISSGHPRNYSQRRRTRRAMEASWISWAWDCFS